MTPQLQNSDNFLTIGDRIHKRFALDIDRGHHCSVEDGPQIVLMTGKTMKIPLHVAFMAIAPGLRGVNQVAEKDKAAL